MQQRKPHILGRSFPLIEGLLQVRGASTYLDDVDFGEELLWAGVLHSPLAHALIRHIDVSRALALPGVHAIITGEDVPGRMGLHLKDRSALAVGRVRYVGEPVVAVAVASPELVGPCLRLIDIEYEPLPAVFDPFAALANDAVLLHPELEQYDRVSCVQPEARSNLAAHFARNWGDLDKGWARADIVISHRYSVPHTHHVSLEPHGGVAQMGDDGHITLWASTQAPLVQRRLITEALGLHPTQLRILTQRVGGGFGGKVLPSIEPIVVALAQRVGGRPVKWTLNRIEEFTSTFVRPALIADIKMGATRSGELTAFEASYVWDGGASADTMAEVGWRMSHTGTGPYRIPNARLESHVVYTNHPPAGPVRGHGMAEVVWALEQHIDRMANAVGIPPVEFRIKNTVKAGDIVLGDHRMQTTGLEQCIRQVDNAIHASHPGGKRPANKRRGWGMAAVWNPVMQMLETEKLAEVDLQSDGTVIVRTEGVDVGQGAHTLMVQLASAELGVPREWVLIMPFDTTSDLTQPLSLGHHLTPGLSNAVLQAVREVRLEVLALVARAWNERAGYLDIVDGVVLSHRSGRTITLAQLITQGVELPSGEMVRPSGHGKGRVVNAPASFDGDVPPFIHFTVGAQAVEVEVDNETGEVVVLRAVAAFDVGHAINPELVRAQIRGGVLQGLGTALHEQLVYSDGQPLNASFRDYRLPTMRDFPISLEPIIVEVPQQGGLWGARGIGEHTVVGATAAVANAVFDAIGVRVDALPITNERMWQALQTKSHA